MPSQKPVMQKCKKIENNEKIACFRCNSTLDKYKAPEWQTDRATHRCPKCGARYKLVSNCLHYIRTIQPSPKHSIYNFKVRRDNND